MGCQKRIGIETVLRTEAHVLQTLDFQVGIPTPITFLTGLTLRLDTAMSMNESKRCKSMAMFLLELALFDADLLYDSPAVVLAAAGLSLAMRALDASSEAAFAEVLEDMLAYCPQLANAEQLLLSTEARLL